MIVVDKHDRAVAAEAAVDTDRWRDHFDTAFAWIAGRFGRVEPRRRTRASLLGLLSDVDTHSCVARHVRNAGRPATVRVS